jgi:hypothetical protein
VLALAKLGFLNFITGGFDTGRFGGLPTNNIQASLSFILISKVPFIFLTIKLTEKLFWKGFVEKS